MCSGVIRLTIVVGSISCLSTIAGHRILACEPSPGHSHWNVMSAVLESLVAAGHEVVCATMHPATDRLAAHRNYTHVDMSSMAVGSLQTARDMDYAQVMKVFRSNAFMVGLATTRARFVCEYLFDMPEIRDILDGNGPTFDAVVMESLHSECMSTLPDRLGVPVVYVVPSPTVNWMPAATGAPDHPSYLGTLVADRPTPTTFNQRLANALMYVHTALVRWYNDKGRDHRWPEYRHSMVFVNTHHSVEPGRPMGPNVHEIGGIHLNQPLAPIPRDLADVLDKSNEFGVIIFTFGSLISMNTLPDDVLDAFKFVFSQLPQTVIWKYENDYMPDKPENVVLCKWLPQRAILQHPNVKLFISHGGMSGVYEVVDAGVPVLGIPLFYDQPRNIQNLVDLGTALSMKIDNLTHSTLSITIDRLLNDKSFSENAKRAASLFRDRPMTPSESVVFWVDYLIRHGTEGNIRPLSADASWTSHFMLDLCAALLVALLMLWFVSHVVLKLTITCSGEIRLAIVVWSVSCLSTIAGHRILACEPCPAHSHWNVMSAVLESLVAAGHEVVCVTMHQPTDRLAAHPNYTHVDMSSLAIGSPQTIQNVDYAQIMRNTRSNAFTVKRVVARSLRMCEYIFDMPEIRDILDGIGSAFDAVVMESLHSKCMSALPDRLGVPVVYVVPLPTVNWMPAATGAPDNPSYLGMLLADRPTPTTFNQRLANALVYVHTALVRWYNDKGRDHRWPEYRHSMVFVNTHHSVEPSRPMGPNVHEIGGIHLNRPLVPIPPDLVDVMDKSHKFGVIVFSLGSLVAMNTLPDDLLGVFKTVFSRLPQTVIWKYESDDMTDKPENVVLCKWLPQRAILQHPNVKLFISHGGMSGVYEVVDAGVPVLGIPLFYDQPRNIQNLVDLGTSLSMKINNLTQTTLFEVINRLIKDRSFSENAKRVASLFRDRPMTPSKTVVFWVDYLIRHGTESNIKPSSADASWTSHFMLDLCAALLVSLLMLWFVSHVVLKLVLNKFIPSNLK